MWHLTAWKISGGLSFLNWIKNEMIFYHISELMLQLDKKNEVSFYRISELMLATLIQRYNKKSFHIWSS